jgi:hypothetical protein
MTEQAKSVGIENKIVTIVRKLKAKYPELGRYEMAFHLDRYKGEAYYDRVLETIEDAGGFRARFTDKSTIDIPIEAIADYDNPAFVEKWGEKIMATRRT